jgi:hypothetical protein
MINTTVRSPHDVHHRRSLSIWSVPRRPPRGAMPLRPLPTTSHSPSYAAGPQAQAPCRARPMLHRLAPSPTDGSQRDRRRSHGKTSCGPPASGPSTPKLLPLPKLLRRPQPPQGRVTSPYLSWRAARTFRLVAASPETQLRRAPFRVQRPPHQLGCCTVAAAAAAAAEALLESVQVESSRPQAPARLRRCRPCPSLPSALALPS